MQNSMDDETSFQELKTPTGVPAGHYVTPTSQINLMQSKKPNNLPMGAGGLNLGSRMNNQMNPGGANADDLMA